jgi:hypothetical protein
LLIMVMIIVGAFYAWGERIDRQGIPAAEMPEVPSE